MITYNGVVLEELRVDVSQINEFAPPLVKQGDAHTRGFIITVTKDGEKLSIPSATAVWFNCRNQTDQTKKASSNGTVNEDGTVTVMVPTVVMEAAGMIQCDVSLITGEGGEANILKSTLFYLNCEESANPDGTSTTEEDNILAEIAAGTVFPPGAPYVTKDKLPIQTENIADGAVTLDKMAAASVDNTQLRALSVSTSKIADGAVTARKMAPGVVPTKTSDLTNDSGFLTQHQDISGKMDRVLRVNDPSRISEIARDQLFECQGAIGITGHSADSSYTGLAKQETMDLAFRDISDIRSYLGYPSGYGTGIVGLQVDFVNKTFTRLADASSLSGGANFDRFRMYGGRRRCNVSDDGTINAFYGDAGYKDDGTNGQVMVYQPAFWYRVVPLRLEENVVGYHIRRANYYISETPRHGFKLHPLFYDANGNALEYVLMSAYEASMYDVSASAYVDDTVDSVAYASGDLLCSVAGQKPISGELSGIGTKANFETMAGNRGTGWHLDTVKSVMANQLLMMIEMGSLNMQEAIGRGVVDCANVGDHNTSSLTGATASLGNATGMALETTQSVAGSTTVNTVDGKLSVTYRGMENPWGNLFKHVQGLNLWGDGTMGGGQAYVCSDDSFNESKHDDNYSPSGICLSNQNGYISAFGYSDEEYDWLLLPTETLGNSALPVGDQLTTVSNINRNGFFQQGGDWSAGTSGGMFYYRCSGGMSGNRKNNIGGRLLYIPTAVV